MVTKEKTIPKYIKFPKHLKSAILNAIKHARRRGEKIPKNMDMFFED